VSAFSSTLLVTLAGALLSTAALSGPPTLPPEPGEAPPHEAPPREAPKSDAEPAAPEPTPTTETSPPPPVRRELPAGLEPIPFPLERPHSNPFDGRSSGSSGSGSGSASPERQSIVDLRDPFNRPPARPRAERKPGEGERLLMPDLKDPFAPGVRRVRSKTLDERVHNDIRDPFRSRPPTKARPPCAKTTDDGTVVQAPGKQAPPKAKDCEPSPMDLRDPFTRDAAR
jgi:hypothetical protein